MGHRHMFNTSQTPETDGDQGWNHRHQPYMPMARASASGSSSLVHSVENMTNHSGPFPSSWNPAPGSSRYSSAMLNAEFSHHQPQAPGPSRDPFPHQPADGNLHMVPDNHFHHPASSTLSGQRVPGVDGGFFNHTMSSGYKRKRPCMPHLYERGSTSGYYDVGSSSNLHLPDDPRQEKQNIETYHSPREYPPGYRGNRLSISGEGTLRNVRSRVGVDIVPNIVRTHMPSNSLHHCFPSRPSDQLNSVDFWGQSSNAPTMEWNRRLLAPGAHESSFFSHGPNTLNAVNSYASSLVESGSYSNNGTSNRNHVPHYANSTLNQSVRGIQSSFDQRSVQASRASSSNLHPGQMAASDEVSQMAGESYPHPRAYSTIRFRTSETHGRTGISSDRYRSFVEEARLRDQLAPEGMMVVDHPTFSGSRTLFDQHRHMRLDVDNMSYEELLVLGERIGSVSTGLSDDLISKCLTKSRYHPSDQLQDDGKCVICLEEYKNMEDIIGTLKCGHDFHVDCVRKWLSIKNLCPICKASATDDDNVKDKLST